MTRGTNLTLRTRKWLLIRQNESDHLKLEIRITQIKMLMLSSCSFKAHEVWWSSALFHLKINFVSNVSPTYNNLRHLKCMDVYMNVDSKGKIFWIWCEMIEFVLRSLTHLSSVWDISSETLQETFLRFLSRKSSRMHMRLKQKNLIIEIWMRSHVWSWVDPAGRWFSWADDWGPLLSVHPPLDPQSLEKINGVDCARSRVSKDTGGPVI